MIGLSEFTSLVGRFHPLLVHLPIGGVIFVFLLELYSRLKNEQVIRETLPMILFFSGCGSVLSLISGYLLSQEGGYGETAIFLHQWSGITVTAGIFVCLILKRTKAFLPSLTLVVLGISITGHYGGRLTHGEGFLTEQLPESFKTYFGIEQDEDVIENVTYEEARMYKHVIYPVLHDKCIGCHNESKMKGDLNMKDFQAFVKGGENGPVFEQFDAEKSEMIKRIRLPETHDDTMPPEGKERITDEELKLIALWIDEDGKEESALDSLKLSDEIKEVIRFRLSRSVKKISPVFNRDVDKTSDQNLEKLKNFGFTVLAVESGSPFLQVNYFNGNKPINEEAKKALISVSEQLVWLNLSGVDSESDKWDFLLQLPYLSRLNLSGTTVGNNVVLQIAKLEYLEMLNLFGTKVDKEILQSLYRTKNLKSLYLGNTEIRSVDTTAISKTENIELEVSF